MIKKLITSILLTVAFYANAQYVKVTPQGLKDNNEDKNELETYFNAVITDYYNYLNGGSTKNEDW